MNLLSATPRRLVRSVHNLLTRAPYRGLTAGLTSLLLGASVLGHAEDRKPAVAVTKPKLFTHIMHPTDSFPDPDMKRAHMELRAATRNAPRANNTGAGIQYTCDGSVASTTCNYLNTTVAGYYNSTFTNANASIFITYGSTGLGQSQGYYNFLTYSQYQTALSNNSSPSAVQTAALSAMGTYDATPYGSGSVEITGAIGAALGFTGLTGTDPSLNACNLGSSGCYNEIITIINDPQDFGFSLYYDDQGGTEPSNAYDYYAVVMHETDEVLGTSSCISTGNNTLTDDCDAGLGATAGTGTPSAVDLFRFSSPGNLVLDSSLNGNSPQYYSYNGGANYGAAGRDGSAKLYNTLANGDDYADYVSSSPDCGTGEAIQDATGCPGEDQGMTILNDGKSEITILNSVGFNVAPTGGTKATMTSPMPGTSLTSTDPTFTWTTASGATGYALWVGTTGAGSKDIFAGGVHNTTSQAVSIPPYGVTIYVRLWTSDNGTLIYNDYTYTEEATEIRAQMSSPSPSSTLIGPTVTFSWGAGGSGSHGEALWVGSTGAGSNNLYSTGVHSNLSATVAGLPTTGGTIYVRLWTSFSGTSLGYYDYTYTAANQAAITSPAPSGTLTGPKVTFNWTTATGSPSGYAIWIGSTGAGSENLYSTGIHNTVSAAVAGLPTNGETIYVRIWTSYSGKLVYADYTYTAAKQAAMTSPASGSTLTSSNVTFSWTTATGTPAGYAIWIGSTGAGSNNLYSTGVHTNTSAAVTGLPTNGETIYVRLWTSYGGTLVSTDYTYKAE